MTEPRRIRITHIHRGDAYYYDRDKYIGLTGKLTLLFRACSHEGYFAGDFIPDGNDEEEMCFHAIRYRRI